MRPTYVAIQHGVAIIIIIIIITVQTSIMSMMYKVIYLFILTNIY